MSNRSKSRKGKSKEVEQDLPQVKPIPPKPIGSMDLKLVGKKPLKLGDDNRPVNPAGCLFLADGKLVKENTLVTCSPDHLSGYHKFASLLNKERKGNDLPELTTDEQMHLAYAFVPLIFRGMGEDAEICIRPNTGIEPALRAVTLLEEGMNVHPGKVKFISISAGDKFNEDMLLDGAESHGMLWRFYPDAATAEEEEKFIEHSIVRTKHGVVLYYSPGSGQRFLTCSRLEDVVSEFSETSDRELLISRLDDITKLAENYNIRNRAYDLSLYNVDEERFNYDRFKEMRKYAASKKTDTWVHDDTAVNKKLSKMLSDHRDATRDGFQIDDLKDPFWREGMYRQLKDIPKEEEYRLGLAREFYAHINWLPGARVHDGETILDGTPDKLTMGLIAEFQRKYDDLEYINIGRIFQSMSKREKTGEETGEGREVYIAVLKRESESNKMVHLMRKQRFDTKHYMEGGQTQFEAMASSERYSRYVMNRVGGIGALGIKRPEPDIIRLYTTEQFKGATIPIEFHGRPYIPAIASDKMPLHYYGNVNFMKKFAGLMGKAAADNLVLSRANRDTGKIFFDDGDEMMTFDKPITAEDKLPVDVVLGDITGSFEGVGNPDTAYADVYAEHLVTMLSKMESQGMSKMKVRSVMGEYFTGMGTELNRIKELCAGDAKVRGLFDDIEEDEWELKDKWARTMDWMESLDAERMEILIKGSDILIPHADVLK